MNRATLAGAETSRFRRYGGYRDSGETWLGPLPIGWRTARLKHLASLVGGGTPAKENVGFWSGTIPWVSPKDMKAQVIVDTEDKITEEAVAGSATRIVGAGTVLIVVRSGILNHTIPVALAGVPAAINQDLKAILHGPDLVPRYLATVIEGHQPVLLVKWRKEGATVESLELDLIKNTRFPVPSLQEQRAIAAFIDRETAKIDALIARKERLIDLLQEKRAALIARMLTKGLDPNVPMKDSGIEWLGEVPTHWRVAPLKHLVPGMTVGIVVTPAKYYLEAGADGVPCLRAVNIASGTINDEDLVRISNESNALHGKSRIFEGDLVIVRTGRAGAAAIVTAPFDGANCMDLLIVRRSDAILPRFLWYFVNSRAAAGQIEFHSVGAIQEHYNTATLSRLLVPAMPKAEQERIVRHLDRVTETLDLLAAKIREGVERLREYRTALISAAVTGKIDVREEAA